MRLVQPVVLALLGANVLAQTNPFIVFPQDPERVGITCASYVRRPNWNNQAEGLQELNASWFRGIGDAGGTALALGFYHWAADENIATAETYGLILRSADAVGRPDITPTGTILSVPGLTTPAATTGGPRGSWTMTDGFATPVVLPTAQTWFQGIDLPANPNWPTTDGYSLWAADSPAINSGTTTGEDHRLGAPFVTWYVDSNSNIATTGWTYILGTIVPAPVLHVGGLEPTLNRVGTAGAASYGMNGLFPDVSGQPRRDGLDLRVQDGTRQGVALAAVALGFQTPAIQIPGIGGSFYLGLGSFRTLGFGVMTAGAATIPLAAPGTVPVALVGQTLTFQCVLVDAATSTIAFTNAQATSF